MCYVTKYGLSQRGKTSRQWLEVPVIGGVRLRYHYLRFVILWSLFVQTYITIKDTDKRSVVPEPPSRETTLAAWSRFYAPIVCRRDCTIPSALDDRIVQASRWG